MAILIDERTTVLMQGLTGRQGRYHTPKMLEYGVNLVGGVSPGKGGQNVDGVPVFDTVAQAARQLGRPDAAMIMVPPAGVRDAALEAIENGIPLVVIVTEFVPYHDSLIVRRQALAAGVKTVGPNTIGVITPGRTKVGIMAGFIYSPGPVGVISRSGTLTHEISSNLTYKGIGQSTCVCIGGDAVKGLDFIDVLKLFRDDDQTEKVVMIGEIGGSGEETAAAYIRDTQYPKKVVAYIAGENAPADKKMGHAGAIVSRGTGTAASKRAALESAGVTVVSKLDQILVEMK
jgi:succinyl-CoA synthetase alpha subunit